MAALGNAADAPSGYAGLVTLRLVRLGLCSGRGFLMDEQLDALRS